MHIVLLIPEYILWHYTEALRLCLNIITNFIWFTYHFFSISTLVKTLFSPWRINRVTSRPGIHPVQISEDIALKAAMNILGPVIRAIVIVCGLTFCVAVSLVGLAVFVTWLFLPIIVVGLILWAFKLIIS